MRILSFVLMSVLLLGTAACSRIIDYNGPEVTRIEVHKSSRQMYLLHHETVLESYEFELGFAPTGHKEVEGDGRTPEGRYYIDRRNPNSDFYLSIGISYPNAEDRARAAELGESPGGDIFIHGTPRLFRGEDDWTWGCIAVTNAEIRQIYAMVNNGTIIDIFP
ncbi:L,D-transpeptidase family protein [Roseobacter sp. HKCCD9010]|uniref:L,D-transpeptidase family protein n=1 Tax=unclassified Roseobacter TaxID=196798 RepID=UPI00149152B1|nr:MULTISPECIES: L,D-transpeptidase family protein [unclassified Roseobacter]MBF9051193.1 L,D-transpeptidase family protein [Rhodobacterales bacterium HKCCD4356]NNV12962.1 L,D-transpeptidase family protein [Roseobacter sp. HKCCD7357]NNV16907.1 L,D-transpeptidase family protein [Roseobacter sp. HKCCD8768]NNV26461.1 L,D-transpeptidase family protein [Roseobacter sp. HKCCD8192]NNV30628.1 L,D-transpeptidase family protein [Roseobacter sp. HKCCD9061]